jgi:hypothetical protein
MRSRHEGICSAAEQCDAIAFLKSTPLPTAAFLPPVYIRLFAQNYLENVSFGFFSLGSCGENSRQYARFRG